jgi:hypothetical protein
VGPFNLSKPSKLERSFGLVTKGSRMRKKTTGLVYFTFPFTKKKNSTFA